MSPLLAIERRATARALPRLLCFLGITAVAYTILNAGEFGSGMERLRMISAVMALIFTALVVNTAIGMRDIARYADIHRAERKRRENSPYERG